MKIYKNLPKKNVLKRSVVSIGSFDGMHLGHQEILKSLKECSKDKIESVVITFHPTPQHFFLGKNFKGYLNSESEKINAIEKQGIDNLCIIEFNDSVEDFSAAKFLKMIIKSFAPKVFIIGYNHCFGKDREGDIRFLNNNRKKYSFDTIEVNEVSNKKIKISSSEIRKSLHSSSLKEANIALGGFYSVRGIVVAGKGLGKKIGFPTANIDVEKNKIIPANGVYFIEADIGDESLKGMCNIGFNPTISNSKSLSVEVHLFDFEKEIYNKEINIKFIDFIRKEKKFDSVCSLKEQLETDKNKCLEYSLYNV